MDLQMLFYRICSLRTDNWVNSTKLFLVFLVSVLAYLVFIHLTSIHRSLTLLVVFRIQYFTICTSSLPVFIHLPHSPDIHLPHSAPILSLATHRLDYSFFTSLLLHAATSTYLPFSEAASRAIYLHFFTHHLPIVLLYYSTCHPKFHWHFFCRHHQVPYTSFLFQFLPLTETFRNYCFFQERCRE